MKIVGFSIDNGGSELRILKNKSGIDGIEKLPGDFYTIAENDFRVKEVQSKLDLQRVLEAPSDFYKGIIACGQTAKAYPCSECRLEPMQQKSTSENYYRQVIFGIARGLAYDIVSDIFIDEDSYNDDVVNVVLGLDIPIREYQGTTDLVSLLKSKLAGTYVVEFPLTDESIKVKFNISTDNIGVLPEGGVCVSYPGLDIQPDDYTLVVDLGHVSNDLSVYLGKRLYGNAVKSSTSAGTTLIGLVSTALSDHNYQSNNEIAVNAIKTGKIRIGQTYVDVRDIVKKSKEAFVKNFVKGDISQLLVESGLRTNQIANIIVVGELMNEDEIGAGYIPQMIIDEFNLEYARLIAVCRDLRYANVVAIDRYTSALLARAASNI